MSHRLIVQGDLLVTTRHFLRLQRHVTLHKTSHAVISALQCSFTLM